MPRKNRHVNRGGIKCGCSPLWMVLGAIAVAIGIFMAVQGFVIQLQFQDVLNAPTIMWIVGYYFVGIVLLITGKLMKWKGTCSIHGGGMHKH